MDFTLEPWRNAFIEAFARYADNPRIAGNLRDVFPSPYTRADAAAFVESCIASDEAASLMRAIVVGGEAVGSISVMRLGDVYRQSAELGYWLGEPFWGKGIMTEAVRRICREAFARWGIARIFAQPFAHNQGSRRVLEKAGFTLEGILRDSVTKCGVLGDSCMYALLRENGK